VKTLHQLAVLVPAGRSGWRQRPSGGQRRPATGIAGPVMAPDHWPATDPESLLCDPGALCPHGLIPPCSLPLGPRSSIWGDPAVSRMPENAPGHPENDIRARDGIEREVGGGLSPRDVVPYTRRTSARRSSGPHRRPEAMASLQRGRGGLPGPLATGRRGRESPAIQTRFSRFRGTVQQGPARRQETQIVQS